MKKNIEHRGNGDMRPEYDFAAMKTGVRGKNYEQYRKGTNVVLIEPDVAAAFPTEDAVNEALRGILGYGPRRPAHWRSPGSCSPECARRT